ncbi:UNVERIFIED_ORG: hypothetical protein QFZ59_000232 [Bacillus sp. B2I3]|nr:hypothetical protein [Bacillus sp. B2I3]
MKKGRIVYPPLIFTFSYEMKLKKSATLLPNNWLAETPLDTCGRRLGRQSAEWERISEINWNLFKEKTVANSLSSNLSTKNNPLG